MFRKTDKIVQTNIFTSATNLLKGRSYDLFSDEQSWNNRFRQQVLSRIEEEDFSVLYTEATGAPNSSIVVLMGMIIIKEAFGWSDSQLFERCRFDLMVRSALGLCDINDSIPTESTYYQFRKNIQEYEKQKGISLIGKAFNKITHGQIAEFEVSGKSIRMDSKLISSNIAFYSRYEIIHKSIALFCKKLDKKAILLLNAQEQDKIKELLEKGGDKIVYYNTKEEVLLRMQSLGELIYKLLLIGDKTSNPCYETLKRVFDDQYKTVEEEKIELRPNEEIQSDSVQSPYDTDCGYRNKDNKPVKGNVYNITETCDKGELNLITDVQTEIATTPDNSFVISGIEQTKKLLGHQVENVHTDGAYHSQGNQDYVQEEKINFYLTGIQGKTARYDL